MYYANKSTFYLKQYGPAVLILVISVVLIGSGIYIYLKSNNSIKPSTNKDVIANVNDTSKNEVSKVTEDAKPEKKVPEVKPEPKVEEVKNEVPVKKVNILEELNSLGVLQKSNKYIVKEIKDNGSIVISNGSTNTEINMVGVEIKNKKQDAINKIKSDLLNKEITLAFDNQRTEKNKMYVYLYIENENLYNENILKSGLATLRTERENISLLDTLLKAQLQAKDSKVGVWR